MSFVLEALQKQEAGKDPDAAVSLARSAVQRRRHRLWMGLFGAAMALNAALLAWLLVPRPDPDVGAVSRPRPPAEESLVPAASAPVVERSAEAGAAGRALESAPTGAGGSTGVADRAPGSAPTGVADRALESAPTRGLETAPTGESAPTGAGAPTVRGRDVELGELPAAARSRFPGIAFSTHVYAEDADLRAVVANGRRLQEGDRIRGLEILRITETGVVLAFEDYRVTVPVVVDWDAL